MDEQNIFDLELVRDTLLESYSQTFSRKYITIRGEFCKFYPNKNVLIDEQGNSIILNYSVKLKVSPVELPCDGDVITVQGFLNFGRPGKEDIIDDGSLYFWFNIDKIIHIEECRNTKIKKIQEALSYKKPKIPILDDFLYQKLSEGVKPNILILCSPTAEQDIKASLGEEEDSFLVTYKNVPLSKKSDASELFFAIDINAHDDYDVLAFSRGGLENYDIFYESSIVTSIVNIKPYTLAALGHAVSDHPFYGAFDRILQTPTSIGVYLKDLSIKVKDELKQAKLREEEQKRMQLIKTAHDKKVRTYKQIITVIFIILLILLIILLK